MSWKMKEEETNVKNAKKQLYLQNEFGSNKCGI